MAPKLLKHLLTVSQTIHISVTVHIRFLLSAKFTASGFFWNLRCTKKSRKLGARKLKVVYNNERQWTRRTQVTNYPYWWKALRILLLARCIRWHWAWLIWLGIIRNAASITPDGPLHRDLIQTSNVVRMQACQTTVVLTIMSVLPAGPGWKHSWFFASRKLFVYSKRNLRQTIPLLNYQQPLHTCDIKLTITEWVPMLDSDSIQVKRKPLLGNQGADLLKCNVTTLMSWCFCYPLLQCTLQVHSDEFQQKTCATHRFTSSHLLWLTSLTGLSNWCPQEQVKDHFYTFHMTQHQARWNLWPLVFFA